MPVPLRLRDQVYNQGGAYAHKASTGAAVVAVPAGALLLTVAASCTAAGATAQIGAYDAVSIPSGGSIEHNVDGGYVGALNVTFIGTATYFVDWVTQ